MFIMKHPHPFVVSTLTFSPDNQYLIATGVKCYLRERKFGDYLLNFRCFRPNLKFMGNGNILTFSDYPIGAGFIDLTTGRHHFFNLRAIYGDNHVLSENEMISVVFIRDEGCIARKWDLKNPKEPKLIWEYKNGEEISSLTSEAILTRDKKIIISKRAIFSEDEKPALDFFRSEDGKLIRSIENIKYFTGGEMLLSPREDQIILLKDTHIRFFDIQTGKYLRNIKKPCRGSFWKMVLHPNQKHYLSVHFTGGEVYVWDAESFEIVRSYKWPLKKCTSIAVSPDGLLCAIGDSQGRVLVWDWEE